LAYLLISTLFILAETATASPVQWTTASGGNGHFYELVVAPGGISWDAAATASTANGGNLATISTPAENAFVFSLASANLSAWIVDQGGNGLGPWLGGFQPAGSSEPSGGWQWVNGEGTFTYTNWATGDPSNGIGSPHGREESRLQFFGSGTLLGSTWNDAQGVPYADVKGYIVESTVFNVPAPSTLLLFCSGLVGLVAKNQRGKANPVQ